MRHKQIPPDYFENIKKDVLRIEKNGLSETATAIRKIINEMMAEQNKTWAGFNRITPSQVSVIIAKILNANFYGQSLFVNSKSIKTVFGTKEDPQLSKIKAKISAEENEKKIKFFKSIDEVKNSNYPYAALLVPIDEFMSIVKKEDLQEITTKIINKCESMPETNNCPGFDYYWLVIPTIDPCHPAFYHSDGNYRLTINDEEIVSDNSEYIEKLFIDLFINKKTLPFCLLGERDKKCYFVSLI
jgi:hypothetical protein